MREFIRKLVAVLSVVGIFAGTQMLVSGCEMVTGRNVVTKPNVERKVLHYGVRYYKDLANGDDRKAEELAAQDANREMTQEAYWVVETYDRTTGKWKVTYDPSNDYRNPLPAEPSWRKNDEEVIKESGGHP